MGLSSFLMLNVQKKKDLFTSLENQNMLARAVSRRNLPHYPSLSHSPLFDSPIASLPSDQLVRCNHQLNFLHDNLSRNVLGPDLQLPTNLIISHAKAGDLISARCVFDRMPLHSVVSWTALISGYARHGSSKEAWALFSRMHCSGFVANEFTYSSVLRACTDMRCMERGKQVHGCALKAGFCKVMFVESALVDLYFKCGRIEDAGYVFDEMEIRDLVCWNAMIGGYAVHALGDEAVCMFREMLRIEMVPDCFTFTSVIKACGEGGILDKVKLLHGFVVKLGFGSDSVVAGSLVHSYARCRSLTCAGLVYNSMRQKDLISSTALITAYARAAHLSEEALKLFGRINQMDMAMDGVIMCSMLSICANLTFLNLGTQIHAFAIKKNANCDTALSNALIDMYAKSGEIVNARQAFDEIREKNVISWTSLLTGYGKHGYGEEALELFKEMENEGLKPNDVTFLSLISACSHSGLISKGWNCFNSMCNNYHIIPRDEHYSCVVDLLARGGRLDEAYDMVLKLKNRPPVSVWGALLGACEAYNNNLLGEIVAKHLFALEPWNAVNYVLLSNIYASAGLWNNALNTRKVMEEKGLKKAAGYSFIPFVRKNTSLLLEAS